MLSEARYILSSGHEHTAPAVLFIHSPWAQEELSHTDDEIFVKLVFNRLYAEQFTAAMLAKMIYMSFKYKCSEMHG